MRTIAANEERILQLFNARDEQALQETQTQYGALCRSVAQNIVGNPEDAEECMNDALLQVWNSIPPAKPNNFSAYLLRILRNIALNCCQKRMTQRRGGGIAAVSLSEMEEFLPASETVESEADRRALLQAVSDFLREIPERQRVLFICRYYRFMDISAIAEKTGMTDNNVQVTLTRIRKKLQEYLRKEGFV